MNRHLSLALWVFQTSVQMKRPPWRGPHFAMRSVVLTPVFLFASLCFTGLGAGRLHLTFFGFGAGVPSPRSVPSGKRPPDRVAVKRAKLEGRVCDPARRLTEPAYNVQGCGSQDVTPELQGASRTCSAGERAQRLPNRPAFHRCRESILEISAPVQLYSHPV